MEIDHNWLALTVTFLIFVIGLIGSLLPVIPGCFVIWLGAVMYWLWVPKGGVGLTYILVTAGLVILAQVLDFVASYYGARKFGASWRGGVGALLGAIIGPFVLTPIIGLIVGPIVGAFLGEISAGRTLKEGGKAGVGTVVGGLIAFAMKFAIAVAMIGWFLFEVFFQ
ncbi:DUF456 domain-containing protein [Cerasicoccus arenae]|uniref:DUF456 domain-containing protein n=1 Tax=Cerasicoccus arenae TaxID=424488 RepID=A0A8J3DLQ0_9BACT|nr:DUF456 family protein [Cerasicoccus arenae]MBK1859829.1 DUF456 domain-containing protein [Cerasicoccus arenae]GHC08401.1 hypothetical protein GCM10007047_27090 [Cerasicoccus arenae]